MPPPVAPSRAQKNVVAIIWTMVLAKTPRLTWLQFLTPPRAMSRCARPTCVLTSALGKWYTPKTALEAYRERGIASWYGRRYHGQKTASGELYDMYGMTAAHPTLPIPSYVRVTNISNRRSVVVRVNDRGPFLSERLIDLSYTAAYKLDVLGGGSAWVEVETILPGGGATLRWPRHPLRFRIRTLPQTRQKPQRLLAPLPVSPLLSWKREAHHLPVRKSNRVMRPIRICSK